MSMNKYVHTSSEKLLSAHVQCTHTHTHTLTYLYQAHIIVDIFTSKCEKDESFSLTYHLLRFWKRNHFALNHLDCQILMQCIRIIHTQYCEYDKHNADLYVYT